MSCPRPRTRSTVAPPPVVTSGIKWNLDSISSSSDPDTRLFAWLMGFPTLEHQLPTCPPPIAKDVKVTLELSTEQKPLFHELEWMLILGDAYPQALLSIQEQYWTAVQNPHQANIPTQLQVKQTSTVTNPVKTNALKARTGLRNRQLQPQAQCRVTKNNQKSVEAAVTSTSSKPPVVAGPQTRQLKILPAVLNEPPQMEMEMVSAPVSDKRARGPVPVLLYKCPVAPCQRRFFEPQTIAMHYSTHAQWAESDGKFFKCPICSKKVLPKNFSLHMTIHTGEKQFLCGYCGKSFVHKSSLNNHVFIHTGNYAHKCEICSKGFSRSSDLVRHKNMHTRSGEFYCEICKLSFVRQNALTSHNLIDHPECQQISNFNGNDKK